MTPAPTARTPARPRLDPGADPTAGVADMPLHAMALAGGALTAAVLAFLGVEAMATLAAALALVHRQR